MPHLLSLLQTNESTSLHLAAEGGHKDVVTVLLDAGADPLVENAVSNSIGLRVDSDSIALPSFYQSLP